MKRLLYIEIELSVLSPKYGLRPFKKKSIGMKNKIPAFGFLYPSFFTFLENNSMKDIGIE
tara:strand:+ start:731 stop:910 length:180 start_codon:yes stop_codon:yes gene_type:complete